MSEESEQRRSGCERTADWPPYATTDDEPTVPKISGGPNTGIKHGENSYRLGETRVKSGSTFCGEPKTLGVACYHYPHSTLRPGAGENVSGPVLSSDWPVLVQGLPDSGLHLHRKTLYPINYKLLFKSDHTFGLSSYSIKTGPSNDGSECLVKTGVPLR